MKFSLHCPSVTLPFRRNTLQAIVISLFSWLLSGAFSGASSQTLTTLVNFNSANGQSPYAALVQGSDGNFYGTTYGGGTSTACNGGGCGTVFKMTRSGTLTTLVNFDDTNGANPFAALVQGSDGNFYGTTYGGGTSIACNGGGCGTVFQMTPSGTITTLLNFNGTNGQSPYAALVQGSDGNFYGTTISGGSNGQGTVFKVTPSGTLTTLVNFDFYINGSYPYAALVQGSDGNFYGTTNSGGGSSYGTVFKVTPSGTLTTLVEFDFSNGWFPQAGLVQGSDGNFYGATVGGGTSLSPGRTSLFQNRPYCRDGSLTGSIAYIGCGTVFKVTPNGTLTTLVDFNFINGANPYAGLVQGSDGNFYGTTTFDTTINACDVRDIARCGTVFKMTPSGTITTLLNFNGTNGQSPYAALVQGSDGNFYGTTISGGSNGQGTVFRLSIR